MNRVIEPLALLRTTPGRCSLLLDLRLCLVCSLLLILQGLGRRIVRGRRRHIRCSSAGVRRRRNSAGALLLGQLAQPTIELFLEVVVHFLQVIHFHGYSLTRRAVTFLAGSYTDVYSLVSIGSVGETREHIA